MYLTDYYKFEHLSGSAKTRLDCLASTRSYPYFERERCTKSGPKAEQGDLYIYCNEIPTPQFNEAVKSKADRSLTIKGKNVSSLFVTELRPDTGFGDFRGTGDALLFVFKNYDFLGRSADVGGTVEVFVARGMKNEKKRLYADFVQGRLIAEMQRLRAAAFPERENCLF